MYFLDKLPDDIGKGTKSKMVNGVPCTKIPYTENYHPHATNIACYVLRYEEEDPANWLINHMDDRGRLWHHFKLPFYKDFPEEWVGGLAQGLTISALIKMYKKTKNKNYLEGARLAFEGLKECTTPEGWICEYPDVPTILNGNLYAIVGIYELRNYYKDIELFYRKCLNNICRNLYKYELSYGWSLYDLELKLPATRFYHEVHVDLLRLLSVLTQRQVLSLVELRWAKYLDGLNWHYASMHRLWKLWRIHGTLGLWKRRKIRKEWLNGKTIKKV